MKKKYDIVRKTNVNRKLIAFLIYIIILVVAGLFNDRYGFLNGIDKGIIVLLMLVFMIMPLIFIFTAGKNYKVIGNIILGPERIKIETKVKRIELMIGELEFIRLHYRGIIGDDHAGYIGGAGGVYSKDGSGNILVIKHNNEIYEYNIVLKSLPDFNALKHWFNEIKEHHNIILEIV